MTVATLKSLDTADLERAIAEAVGALVGRPVECSISEIAYEEERDGATLALTLAATHEGAIGFK